MTIRPTATTVPGALPLFMLICLVAPPWAVASTVWRCESAGRVVYTDQSCQSMPGGVGAAASEQRSVQADDPRSTEQRREAQAVARQEERLLSRLEQERRLRQKEAPRPTGAVIIGLPPDPLAPPGLRPGMKDPKAKPKRSNPPAGPSGART